jgi:hypothetical protein
MGHIDVMPGKGYPWSRRNPLRDIGPLDGSRVVTLNHTRITKVQRKKLTSAQVQRLARGEMTLIEMFDLGKCSFINVTVYGADRFSGTHTVFEGRAFKWEDLPPAQSDLERVAPGRAAGPAG